MPETMQIDFDDYTQRVEDVARAERGPMTGDRLADEGRTFYDENPVLLKAHLEAARLLQDRGVTVSARFLTEFARWATKLTWLMPELYRIYAGVPVEGRDGLKIPNATSAWLTRWLRENGIRASRTRSKMDGDGRG